jgi:hypothetical protein
MAILDKPPICLHQFNCANSVLCIVTGYTHRLGQGLTLYVISITNMNKSKGSTFDVFCTYSNRTLWKLPKTAIRASFFSELLYITIPNTQPSDVSGWNVVVTCLILVCLSNVPSAQTIQKAMDRTWMAHGEPRNVQNFGSENSRQITRVTYAYRQHDRLMDGTRIYVQPNRIREETNNNLMSLVRERTIPTELQPLVGEVSANFCG